MAEQDNNGFNIFGFNINRKGNKKSEEKEMLPSIVPPTDNDGAGYVTTGTGGAHATALMLDNNSTTIKDDIALIKKYREAAMHPEVDQMISHITNEAISGDREVAQIDLDTLEASNNIKNKIKEEFDGIVEMLDFNNTAAEMFQRFYIDGRLHHHLVVDPKKPQLGIQEMRYIDSLAIRKHKEIEKETDERTGVEIIKNVKEYFVFDPKVSNNSKTITPGARSITTLPVDSVSYITSGLLDTTRTRVVGHLDKVLKPLNNLRMMEDAMVIYRLARAPERRIFYVDVGKMGNNRAKEYINDLMNKYRNKMTYDANTGTLTNNSRSMSMLEDFWLPRQEGGKGTEVTTLAGGQNLGELDDVVYMQKKLYKAGNVPLSRLEQEAQFTLGRTSELTRDEQYFKKFVDNVTRRFSKLIIETLGKQLVLKKICTEDEWNGWKSKIYLEFLSDSYFTELKNAEIIGERIERLDRVSSYVGEYFSREWVMKELLMMSDDEITAMNKQMKAELDSGIVNIDTDVDDEAPAEKEAPAKKEAGPEIDVSKTKDDDK